MNEIVLTTPMQLSKGASVFRLAEHEVREAAPDPLGEL